MQLNPSGSLPLIQAMSQNLQGSEILTRKNASKQSDLIDNESNSEWSSKEDKSLKYIPFANNSNLCWLNSSMSLIAHNKTIQRSINSNSSIIYIIMKGYKSAISVYNDYSNSARLPLAEDLLQRVQDIVLKYLEPIMKCKNGLPDSAFCAVLNLINENKEVKNLFLVEYFCIGSCKKCAHTHVKNLKKTIITLSKVRAFNPDSPVCLYKCPKCESQDQELEIKYKTLPQCLIFHFENGAGEGPLKQFELTADNRKYKLSGFIALKKGCIINHFVTWIRDVVSDTWLECNDLNSNVLSFTKHPTDFKLEDLYLVMYEALDNKGTTLNVSADTANINRVDLDDTSSSCIPLVDLSDEEEFAENVLGKDHAISSSKLSIAFEIEENPVTSQDNNVLMEESDNLNMGEPINEAEDFLQNEDESGAKSSVLSTCPKKLMKKFVSKYDGIAVEECELEGENFPENAVANLDKNLPDHGAEKSVETSTLAVHTPFTQEQLQVENLPSKMPFVLLTKMENREISNDVSGKVNFVEELTKTVAVKDKVTSSKPELKRKAEQIDYLKTKVRRVDSGHKRNRRSKQCYACSNYASVEKGKNKKNFEFKDNAECDEKCVHSNNMHILQEIDYEGDAFTVTMLNQLKTVAQNVR
ncbi:uncharacterized protein LOC129959526 [Argiope bruennichi]|uniref:SUMO-specific isopeptidase USPL1 like protein n=1 Tax=Argiope bruennichi TaxID=94029 RepID=A0A8T0F626_ARGBR|nr:uncharacterized protein LOC129959526 [Argiope bruennichi]XP_055928372.1 uncharacterized protein LOC129959526 [Argiope bruennichi]KAF8784860.1 SUMO-specific isopeptidase USPL1 like protein [Argiope bruennichi]